MAAVVASVLFTVFTVDIGDVTINGKSLRTIAEERATKFLERPLHIGSLSAHLTPGRFVLRDVSIEGPTPQDRPFFSAKQITVDVPWWTLFNQRQLYIEIRLSAWRMVVEKGRDGQTFVPRFTSRTPSDKPFPLKIRGLAVYGSDGEFIYDDHATPWSVIGRNLKFDLVRSNNLNTYVGLAEFSKGTVQIQKYEPMEADFRTRFQVDGGVVRLKHIDLITDGAESHIGGFVNFRRWPEQEYRIQSIVDLNRMRELFFAKEDFRLSGVSRFNGVFKLFKDPEGRGSFDMTGLFKSDEAGLGLGHTEWRFPNLDGSLQWTPTSFTVHRADTDFLGGRLTLGYRMAPLGTPAGYNASLTGDYNGVDLHRLTRQFGWTALEPKGRMHGHVAMAWPKGQFGAAMEGTGNTTITAPPGVTLASSTLPASAEPIPAEVPFQKFRPFGEFGIGGVTSYRFSRSSLEFDPSWVATPTTYVRFDGRARGGPADLRFHVTSHDWQNSDRLFAAIMSNFSRPMGGIDVGGRGTFDGTLTKEFRAPRIEGSFAADNMRAWGEVWGKATGDIVVENSYLTVTNGLIEHGSGGRIHASGKYSLGYPRADGGEEINSAIRVESMPLRPLKDAFTLQDWPVDGRVALADVTLRGGYEKPSGTGEMRLEQVTAWDEPFDYVEARRAAGAVAQAGLVFEGDGSLRVNRLEMAKGPGRIRGSAWVSWATNTYSFGVAANAAEGGGLPVEELKTFKMEATPLTGILSFKASGVGSFDSPAWRIDDGRIPDLYIADEAIGAVGIRMSLTNRLLTIEEVVAEHDRLHLGCSGTIAMNEASDARLRCQFTNASLDPYLKFVARELPYTRAIVTGSVDVVGALRDRSRLNVDARIEDAGARLTLFDFPLENDGLLHLAFRQNTFRLERMVFTGADTSLTIGGTANLTTRVADIRASGQANLKVLQAFYPSLDAGGSAELQATLTQSFDRLAWNGSARISEGEMRHRDMPHGLRGINGTITVEAGRISVDGLRAVLGEGPLNFSGGILLDGYQPQQFDIHAIGRSMHLRYPEGLQSTVNANLWLRGPIKTPVLSGDVTVLRASYSLRYKPEVGYFNLLTNAVDTGGGGQLVAVSPDAPSTFPLGLAIKVRSDAIPFVENKNASAFITARVNLDIGGTTDQPIVTGDVEVERGEWIFAGNRYELLSGSITFNDRQKFDPFFELTAETPVRTPGQTYNVTVRITGTLDRLNPSFTSEPWLPEFQIVSLLLGETADVDSAELRQLRSPQELQATALQQAGVAIITSPVSATVGSVFQKATTVDLQIVPFLGNESEQLNPGARFILGKRISRRVYLTYSRTLSGNQNEIILIEFDQTDQLSWVLSRNEDRTFALDFRLRYVFR